MSLLSTTGIVKDATVDWKFLDYIKVLPTVTRNPSYTEGVKSAIELQNIGKLSNIMQCGFKANWNTCVQSGEDYCEEIHLAMYMYLAVGI